jgi:hypothetical protein
VYQFCIFMSKIILIENHRLLKRVWILGCCILILSGCKEEIEIPEPLESYIFLYTSKVDAQAVNCGYTYYEEAGDRIKKHLRNSVPNLSKKELIELGNYFKNNYVVSPITEHTRSPWAKEIIERMKPFLIESGYSHTLFTLEDHSFSAFTVPGGNIFITTGLLDQINEIDELAYIIGHELGHNENNHTTELARLYKYVENKSNEGGILNYATTSITQLGSKICGKPDELECDLASMYLLHKAGYDPEIAMGGVELLKMYSEPKPEEDWRAALMAFFKSHPWSEDRDICIREYIQEAKFSAVCEHIYSNKKGFIATKQSPLELREFPIKRAKSIYKIPKGAKVQIVCDCIEQEYRINEEWLYVLYKTKDKKYYGWVDKKFIKPD